MKASDFQAQYGSDPDGEKPTKKRRVASSDLQLTGYLLDHIERHCPDISHTKDDVLTWQTADGKEHQFTFTKR